MGVGYFKNLTQWSKGEYLNAYEAPTNPQDDLFVITEENNGVDYRTDDHGNDFSTSSYLRINSDGSIADDGVIETSTDVDVFRFSMRSSGWVTFNVDPVSAGPNLDVEASIHSANGSVIESDNPENEISASISRFLFQGTYTFQVKNSGRGDPLVDGYTDYASLGFYKITGSIPNAELPQRFQVIENTPIDEFIDEVIPQRSHRGDIYFYFDSGNELDIFYIEEEAGEIYVNDDTLLDFEGLTPGYESPEFELFVEIIDDEDEDFNELLRIIIEVTDVNEPPTVISETTYLLEGTMSGTPIHKVQANDEDYGDALTYAITGGNTTGNFAIDPSTGEISVIGSVTTNAQLTVTVTDSDSLSTDATIDVTLVNVSGSYVSGSIQQTYFEDIPGTAVSDLTTNPRFPLDPDDEQVLFDFSTSEHGDNYGSTIRGYLIPPVTGDYTFWLASDDAGQLLLSPDSTNSALALINSVSSWTDPQDWATPSSPVSLVAGQAYYVEVRYKEGTGSDHASVAWQGPGIPKQLIPGKYLSPYFQNYPPKLQQATFKVQADAYPNTFIGTVIPSDVNTSDTHSGFAIVSGNSSGAFAIDPTTGTITIAARNLISVGQTHNLEIELTDSGTPPADRFQFHRDLRHRSGQLQPGRDHPGDLGWNRRNPTLRTHC